MMLSPARPIVALACAGALHIGGVERYLVSLLRAEGAARFRWLFIGQASAEFAAQLAGAGAEVIHWSTRSQWDIGAVRDLGRILREQRVDLLHTQDPRASIFGRLAARVPVLVGVHTPVYYFDGIRANPLKRRLYQVAEGVFNRLLGGTVVYVSQAQWREAVALGIVRAGEACAIDNGIDLAPYAPGMASRSLRVDIPDDVPVVCCVGRLVEQKGVDVLLTAIAPVMRDHQDCRLWIVGDGPLRGALEAQAAELGLSPRTTFWGFRGDIPDLLTSSDLVVLPSRYEGMPILLLEALAAGKPCVVTAVGENAFVVRDGEDGFVVPPEDADALSAAVESLLTSPELRARMAASALARSQNYDVRLMARRVFALYDSLLTLRDHSEDILADGILRDLLRNSRRL